MTSKSNHFKRIHDLGPTANARRIELARAYLSASQVQSLLGIDATDLTAWREERRLLAVYHEPANAWLYPDFQFDGNGVVEQMPRLLAAFEHHYSYVWENTWGIVEWFLCPHVLLDGACPAEAMSTVPERVLEIALVEFLQDRDEQW